MFFFIFSFHSHPNECKFVKDLTGYLFVMDNSLHTFLAHIESVKVKSRQSFLDDFDIHMQ